ncbi:15959_t:CDS:2 [Acaulospora morrowiae]|uniref:15959_t:CDS:1 n=1 Tax=Acaulospora morrowiae TaxID=94023 RepID=A0A9N9A3A2_9GLOM|nr:15959_t:CDS:2 [Acaulospora morrowiae]
MDSEMVKTPFVAKYMNYIYLRRIWKFSMIKPLLIHCSNNVSRNRDYWVAGDVRFVEWLANTDETITSKNLEVLAKMILYDSKPDSAIHSLVLTRKLVLNLFSLQQTRHFFFQREITTGLSIFKLGRTRIMMIRDASHNTKRRSTKNEIHVLLTAHDKGISDAPLSILSNYVRSGAISNITYEILDSALVI